MVATLSEPQKEAVRLLGGKATSILLRGGSRCVAGDTVLDGQTKTIAELAREGRPVKVITSWGEQWAEAPFKKGTCRLVTIKTVSGRQIRVTPDHRFWDGSAWKKACDFSFGDEIAGRTSQQNLPQTSSGCGNEGWLAGVLYSRKTHAGYPGGYSSHRHLCDRLPPPEAGGVLVYRASLCDELGRSLRSLLLAGLSLLWRGSGSHKAHLFGPSAEDTLSGLQRHRPSMTGGFPCEYLQAGYEDPVFEQTYAQSRGSRSDNPRYQVPFCADRSSPKPASIGQRLWTRLSYLLKPHDTPYASGYALDRVIEITPSAVEDYYTLHVPGCEHYFANGLLHHNSGKTFVLVRSVVVRAAKAPGSRHGIFRHRFNSLKASVVRDTFPKVMRECFPELPYKLNQTDWFVTFPNGSEIHFHGLDSEDRTEKILGLEFATVYLNEASQISYNARNILLTRLAQKTNVAPKEYIDANPPSTSHWLHDLFEKKIEPKSGEPLPDPEAFATMRINPDSNKANLTPQYLAFLDTLPERERIRFRDGNYQSAVQGALWNQEDIKRDKPPADGVELEALKARMRRIVVAIDPSGCAGKEDFRSDEIGIIVCGIDKDKRGHVLEDQSGRYGPAEWGALALKLYDKWQADVIVAEGNFGGAMVESNIRTVRASVNVRIVRASRGKVARAEPIAALYEQGKVVHHGRMTDLEEQLCQFTAAGYQGYKSPDRADAMVWGLTELMLGQTHEPARWKKQRFSIGR